jgi:hypothetical protein
MKWLKENSLGVVLLTLFLLIWGGQSLAGFRHYNDEQQQHGQPEITYSEYLSEGQFIEATFENWESEFLQMAAYVLLTVHLRQKGSSESKKIKGEMPVDQEPRQSNNKDAPWPVRVGGVALKIYKHSLSLAFIILFLLSFMLHAYGGAQETCQENLEHGQAQCESTFRYLTTSKFWFESLQNWQSEFLAVFAIVVLTIFLREKGSPESKPVNAPHYATGSE